MKAAVYLGGGQFELLEKPVPKLLPGESLLEVSRVGICGTDLRICQGHMKNRVHPGRILGHEAVATIRETCQDGKFKTGDRVAVEPKIFCETCVPCRQGFTNVCENLCVLGIDADGAFQQFWAVPDHRLHHVPEAIAEDHAAMIEPLAVAVHAVRLSAVQPGQTVAVIGAGTIGLMIATLARKKGAAVVVLEINPHRMEFARRLQFEVLNSAELNNTRAASRFASGSEASVIFEASGAAEGARLMTALAAVRGRVILVGIHNEQTPTDLNQIFVRELSIQGTRAYSGSDFKEAIRLLSTGEINLASYVSKHYPLSQLQAAMEYALSGAPTMKILIDVRES